MRKILHIHLIFRKKIRWDEKNLSLDKWIKSAEKEEAKKKPKETKRKHKNKGVQSVEKKDQENKKVKPTPQKIIKHHLQCSKKGCNYQKTIVKKDVNEKDTICPRCKSVMKAKWY